jgi:hypothetical protein
MPPPSPRYLTLPPHLARPGVPSLRHAPLCYTIATPFPYLVRTVIVFMHVFYSGLSGLWSWCGNCRGGKIDQEYTEIHGPRQQLTTADITTWFFLRKWLNWLYSTILLFWKLSVLFFRKVDLDGDNRNTRTNFIISQNIVYCTYAVYLFN